LQSLILSAGQATVLPLPLFTSSGFNKSFLSSYYNYLKAISGLKLADISNYKDATFLPVFPITSKKALIGLKGA
jgi:hypothetical protein